MKCGSVHFSFELTPAGQHAHAMKEVLGPVSNLQLCLLCRVLLAHQKCPLAPGRHTCLAANTELFSTGAGLSYYSLLSAYVHVPG